MDLAIFIIYAVVALTAVVFFSLREFHMLQLNGYKTPEHSWWMKKNYKRYIFPAALFLIQFLLFVPSSGFRTGAASFLCAMNLILILANKPGKKFKKPLKYTARVKRMMTTFFIITAILFAAAALSISRVIITENTFDNLLSHSEKTVWSVGALPFFLVNVALYLTPILVPLSNIINKPIETSIQKWYINDARKIIRSSPSLHVIGITGSYGKTSMKFYLSELLNSQYNTLKTPESFNTPMGVTITVRNHLKPTHEIFVCEMGARRVGEIKELCEIAFPQDGIITSVGPQHLETFKSIENVVGTKFELADSIPATGKIYMNGDNELIRKKSSEYKNAVTYGLKEGNDYRAADVSVSDRGTEFTVITPDGEQCRFSTKLLGEHSVQNVLGAIAYCHGLGMKLEKLVLPVKRIAAVPHRLQLLDVSDSLCYIDDAYNSNPNGCRAALSVLGLFDACKILVTPGMVELGEKQNELNYEFGTEAAKVCDFIALVGKNQTKPIYEGIASTGYPMDKVFVADSLNDALAKVKAYNTSQKKVVLLENDLPDNY